MTLLQDISPPDSSYLFGHAFFFPPWHPGQVVTWWFMNMSLLFWYMGFSRHGNLLSYNCISHRAFHIQYILHLIDNCVMYGCYKHTSQNFHADTSLLEQNQTGFCLDQLSYHTYILEKDCIQLWTFLSKSSNFKYSLYESNIYFYVKACVT